LLSSCEKESQDVSVKSESNLLSEAEIVDIGVKHNEALAFVLKELQKHPDLNKEQKSMKASMATEKYLRNNNPENNEAIIAAKEAEYRIYKRFNKSKVKSVGSSIISILKENESIFSEGQKELLLECDNIISKSSFDLEEVIDSFNMLKIKTNKLPIEEQSVVLAALEVGSQSAIYWNENLTVWNEALNGYTNKETKGWFNFGNVVKSDVAGAVGGAVTAAVVNVIPGAGQVAYGAAILGGAAGSSTCSAVSQILDHCFYPEEGSHISYFTNDSKFLRFALINDISKIETVEGEIIDFNKVQLYFDANGNLPYLASLKEVKLFAYEKQAFSNSHFINVQLNIFEDKSCTVKRHFVGTTFPENASCFLEGFDDGGRDSGELLNN
jgi:hypothetical protein